MKLKKIAVFCLSACYFLLQMSCKPNDQKTKPSDESIEITGEIQNYDEEQFEFTYFIYSPLEGNQKSEVAIDTNGRFLIEVNSGRPLQGVLSFGRHNSEGRGIYRDFKVYAEPGDSIHVKANVDLESDLDMINKTLTFSGSGIANNMYIKQEDEHFDTYPQRVLNNHKFIRDKNPNAYKKTVDSIRDARIEFLEKFNAKNKISENLEEIYRAKIENLAVVRKFNYPSSNAGFNDGVRQELPSDYYDFIDEVKIASNLDEKGLPYLRYLHFFLKNKYALLTKDGYNEDYITFLDTELEERAKYIYMGYSLSRDFNPEVYAQFGSESPFPDLTQKVRNKYKHLEKMLPGNPAPQVRLISMDNDTLPTGKFYKNTAVYIDFWATWCKPCIKEIPDLNRLEEEYANDNIKFVSISFDAKRETWENFVQKEGMTGNQMWVNKENKKIYDEGFNITMIPRFVLIDENGNIVDANAPRPSSGSEIRNLLDKTLLIHSNNSENVP